MSIAQLCIDAYTKLPKVLKCADHEWTVLAGIVVQTCHSRPDHSTGQSPPPELRVLALTTGSRCLGQAVLCPHGTAVADCHAEILARRVLQRYLMYDLMVLCSKTTLHNEEDSSQNTMFFEWDHDESSALLGRKEKRAKLKKGISFHLYVSHSPCGDASIDADERVQDYDENNNDKNSGDIHRFGHREEKNESKADLNNVNIHLIGEDEEWRDIESPSSTTSKSLTSTKRVCLDSTFRATGAKLIGSESSAFSTEQHWSVSASILGALRTKSGRSDLPPHLRTLSMSCSDKIARWRVKGIQGSKLNYFLSHPIFFSSITIGWPKRRSCESVKRAFHTRLIEEVRCKHDEERKEDDCKLQARDDDQTKGLFLPSFKLRSPLIGISLSPSLLIQLDSGAKFPECKSGYYDDLEATSSQVHDGGVSRISSTGKCLLWAADPIFAYPQRVKGNNDNTDHKGTVRDYSWVSLKAQQELLQGATGLRFGLPTPKQKFKVKTLIERLNKQFGIYNDLSKEPKILTLWETLKVRLESVGMKQDLDVPTPSSISLITQDQTITPEGGILCDLIGLAKENPDVVFRSWDFTKEANEAKAEGNDSNQSERSIVDVKKSDRNKISYIGDFTSIGTLLVERQSYISSVSKLSFALCLVQIHQVWGTFHDLVAKGAEKRTNVSLTPPPIQYLSLNFPHPVSSIPTSNGCSQIIRENAFKGWTQKSDFTKSFWIGRIEPQSNSDGVECEEDWIASRLALDIPKDFTWSFEKN